MEFIADENVPRPMIARLRTDGFKVRAIVDQAAGALDTDVLLAADAAGLVLITQDTDFGELAVAQRRSAAGIVLIKLARLPLARQIERVSAVVGARQHKLIGALTLIEPGRVRLRPLPTRQG
jgi:predicted nuclease of predicted toxin-antitoxin system